MSNRNLYLAALVASLTAALFGYSVGFIGGILVLSSFLSHFSLDLLTPDRLASALSGTVAIWLLGALLGVPLCMPLCTRFGKRACLTACAALYSLGVALQLGNAQTLALFDVGRFVNGLGVGAGTLVSPMYIAEISTPETRGMLLSGYQTVLQLGALIGFWAAFAAHALFLDTSSLQWQIPVVMQLVPGVSLLLGTLLIPESPHHLVGHGRLEAAQDALSWLKALPTTHAQVEEEMTKLRYTAAARGVVQNQKPSFWSEIKEKSLRKRLAVGVGLMIAQNMVGLNALNYYAPKVFISAGFTSVSSSLFLTGMFGLIKLASSLSFMFVFVGIRGNRFWLKMGSLICGVSMIVLAICVRHLVPPTSMPLGTYTSDLSSWNLAVTSVIPKPVQDLEGIRISSEATGPFGWIAVLMVYVFAFSFGISLGPISWNICSEIFPAHIKAECCAITTCTQWLFQIVIAGITPYLLAKVGWGMYLVYAVCCAISLIWIHVCVPETQGVALGRDMDELFGQSASAQLSEAMEEVDETTALLGHGVSIPSRRDSIGYV